MTSHIKSLLKFAFSNTNSNTVVSNLLCTRASAQTSILTTTTSTKNKLKLRKKKMKCENNNENVTSNVNTIENKLKQACKDKPANIPMLVIKSHIPVVGSDNCCVFGNEIRVRKGSAVNALFMKDNWIYVKTFEENEGYLPMSCCEPFGVGGNNNVTNGVTTRPRSYSRKQLRNCRQSSLLKGRRCVLNENTNHTYMSIVDESQLLKNVNNETTNDANNNSETDSYDIEDNTNLSLFSVSRCYIEPSNIATKTTSVNDDDMKNEEKHKNKDLFDSLRKSKSRNRQLSIAVKQVPASMTLTMLENNIENNDSSTSSSLSSRHHQHISTTTRKTLSSKKYIRGGTNISNTNNNFNKLIKQQQIKRDLYQNLLTKYSTNVSSSYKTTSSPTKKQQQQQLYNNSQYIKNQLQLQQHHTPSLIDCMKRRHEIINSDRSSETCSSSSLSIDDYTVSTVDQTTTTINNKTSNEHYYDVLMKYSSKQDDTRSDKSIPITNSQNLKLFKVVRDYTADFKDDLSVRKGDIVCLVSNNCTNNNEWIFVRRLNTLDLLNDVATTTTSIETRQGYIPRNYVINL